MDTLNSSMLNVPAEKYRHKKPTIIIALPDKVKSKNFIAEYSFLPEPHIEIRKNNGIISNSKKKKHQREMNKERFPSIDLIIVNFYPFQKTVIDSKNPKKIIENIDIGGPTMVRAAAKNFKDVTIVTDKSDYQSLIKEMKKNNGSRKKKLYIS